jgi:hypothetical protein
MRERPRRGLSSFPDEASPFILHIGGADWGIVRKRESLMRRYLPSVMIVLCLALAVPGAPRHAVAQEGGLTDMLGGLLRGGQSGQAQQAPPSSGDRRVPFSEN